jgi:hypothetical protein
MKDVIDYYYIQKVEHRASETLCFYADAGFHFGNIKVVKPISRPRKTKKDLQEESQLLLLLLKQDASPPGPETL